jgi:hypothetical protein
MQTLEGLAQADAHLERRMPLPAAALPLARWVEVLALGPGVEIAWNLDDTRHGAPGRLALYAGAVAPDPHALEDPSAEQDVGGGIVHREAPLPAAQPSLRPVQELQWRHEGLHLRLTAQGPWDLGELVAIARSVR